MICQIVPPYLLRRIARLDDPAFAPAAEAARKSLLVERPWKGIRVGEVAPHTATSPTATSPTDAPPRQTVTARQLQDARRTISDTHNTEALPGDVVTSELPDGRDDAVLEAWQGLGHTHELAHGEGNAWERAGQIWYSSLTSGSLSAKATFAEFAALTVTTAGSDAALVTTAWETVGVL